jgi:sugar porter (SP) family MFS transporter
MSDITGRLVLATAIVSVGGILFGYDIGVISCALPQLTEAFDLTQTQESWVVSVLYIGGGIGAAIGGVLCDHLGRRTTIMISDLIFMVGSLLLFFAQNFETIIAARLATGIGIAVTNVADTAYLHEIAPLTYRGAIVSTNEASISFGFVIAFTVGAFFEDVGQGWRYMFAISGLKAFCQFLGMSTLPESPVWLQERGHLQDSEKAIFFFYGDDEPPPISNEDAIQEHDRVTSLADFVRSLYVYRRQGYIAVFLMVCQQLSGQTAILSFAPEIFRELGSENFRLEIWIGLAKFFTTVLVVWKIEAIGRKTLLWTGMAGIVWGQILISLAYSIDGGVPFAVFGIVIVVVSYSVSFGPLAWLLISEMFPTTIRGRCLGAGVLCLVSVLLLLACFSTHSLPR